MENSFLSPENKQTKNPTHRKTCFGQTEVFLLHFQLPLILTMTQQQIKKCRFLLNLQGTWPVLDLLSGDMLTPPGKKSGKQVPSQSPRSSPELSCTVLLNAASSRQHFTSPNQRSSILCSAAWPGSVPRPPLCPLTVILGVTRSVLARF